MVNNDAYDLLVELVAIVGGRAHVKVTSINELITQPTEETTPTEEITPTEEVTPTEELMEEDEEIVVEKPKKSTNWVWYSIIILALLVILYVLFKDRNPKYKPNRKF